MEFQDCSFQQNCPKDDHIHIRRDEEDNRTDAADTAVAVVVDFDESKHLTFHDQCFEDLKNLCI